MYFRERLAVFVSPLAMSELIVPAAVTAHEAIFLFLLTESFGSLSQKRSKTSRIIARVFFGLSALVVSALLVQGVWRLAL